MNKDEILDIIDELRMRMWELRDRSLHRAQNETWELIHKAPYKKSRFCVDTIHVISSEYLKMLDQVEAEVKGALPGSLHFEEIREQLNEMVANMQLDIKEVLNLLKMYEIKLSNKAVYRKSYIRD